MKNIKIVNSLILLFSILLSAIASAADKKNNKCEKSYSEIAKLIQSDYFKSLSLEDQIDFLNQLRKQGIDLSSEDFEFTNVDEFENLLIEKPVTIPTVNTDR